jgi:Na+-transporting NADH:ubiquinone oxidoreductase subunit NqrB
MSADPRHDQILFLSLFLILGFLTRDWSLQPTVIGLCVFVCLATQLILARQQLTRSEAWNSLKSSLITSLSLCLLLRTDQLWVYALAGVLAIASKFVIQVNHKHVFNPANVGMMTAILLTQSAWVSPGQWGEEIWFAALFLALGGIVLRKVGRWDTTLAFLGSYALMEVARNVYLGWTWDVVFHRLSSGSLLLFALFMITDPRSIPNARVARILWAIAIAALTFVFRNVWFVSAAPFWALLVLSPCTPILDWIWQAPRFTWLKPKLVPSALTSSAV